jgi:hypothetical protein
MKQKPSVLGIDLAKRIFHLVGMDEAGHVVLNKTPYGRTLGTSELSSGTSSLCG